MLPIFMLPSVPLKQKHKLPQKSGVYFATSGFRVLYVGKAKNFRTRWRNHDHLIDLQRYRNVRIHYQPYPLWLYSHVEAREIQRLKPPLNGRIERMNPLLSFVDTLMDMAVVTVISVIGYFILRFVLNM